jgi:chromosomal replication initiation ATPase DnaA
MAAPASSGQIPLDLVPGPPSYARAAFLVSPCNRRAHEAVLGWRAWPGGRLVLSGPEATGKTHLARIWAESAGATTVSAPDLAAADPGALAAGNVAVEAAVLVAGQRELERALLHLNNAVAQAGGSLLLTSRPEPGRWALTLPDLASRMAAAPHVRLAPPDDALLAAVMVKLFEDRQVRVAPWLVNWLVARMDRSLASARRLVAQLDAAALAAGGPVTRRLAEAILDNTDGSGA